MTAATQELVLAAAGSGININSTQPPGTQGIITVVNYVAWGGVRRLPRRVRHRRRHHGLEAPPR